MKIKFSPIRYRWKLPTDVFGYYKKTFILDNLKYDEFRDHLNGLHDYYLNEYGLSVNPDGSPIDIYKAQFVWADLGIMYNGEPLFVWMRKKNKGGFYKISIGNRISFDTEICRGLDATLSR